MHRRKLQASLWRSKSSVKASSCLQACAVCKQLDLQNDQKLPPPPTLFSVSKHPVICENIFSSGRQSRTWQRLKSILSKHCAGRGDDVTGQAGADGHHTASGVIVIISAPPAFEKLNTLDWRMRTASSVMTSRLLAMQRGNGRLVR